MLHNLLPDPKFSATEISEIYTKLTDPLLRKYLMFLGMQALKDISTGAPLPEETAEAYLYKQQRVAGTLAAIESLLDVARLNQGNSL